MTTLRRRLMSRAADIACSAVPRRRPSPARLAAAHIVAHRGNTEAADPARENTLAAFDACLALGVFGIEFDVQWTADGVPVVMHDAMLAPGGEALAGLGFEALRARTDIPSLADVVGRFGGAVHLMVELKSETFDHDREPVLAAVLAPLEAGRDYHLLCLDPSLLGRLTRFARAARIAVAETNTREIVEQAIALELGGVAGHYVLLNRRIRRQLAARGMRVGVGMVPNTRVLRRELALGADFIFTDRAAPLVRALARWRAGRGGIL